MNANERSPLNIMVVDDSAVVREVMTAVLSQEPGFNVTVAADPFIAMGKMKNQRPDVIILDLEMPNMNGYELLGCIRGAPSLKHLPVIVLTAKEDRTSLERALVSGATSYLVKPLNWTAFGAHITHLLQLARSARRGAESPNVAVA